MKNYFHKFLKLALIVALVHTFAGGIAQSYHVPAPNWKACAEAVLLLEIAGHLLRGKAPWFFEEQ